MSDLNKQDLLAIGIKLLALYWFLMWIVQIPGYIMMIAEQFMSTIMPKQPWLLLLSPTLVIVLVLLLSVFLWIGSERIAKWAVKSNNAITIKNSDSPSLQAMLFCAVGLFIFLMGLPKLIQWVIQYLVFIVHSTPVYMASYGPRPLHWISLVLQVGLGLAVMLKSKGLAALIHKLRYAGSKTPTGKS